MTSSLWRRRTDRLRTAARFPRRHSDAQKSRRLNLFVESLEDRLAPAAFAPGDIAVLQLAATGDNTTGSVLELAPSGAAQTPALTVAISSTGSTPMRFSDSGTSSFLSDTNDGTLLVLSGYNTTDSTDADLASSPAPLNDRAVATLDSNTNFTLQTTYTGTSGNQTRSATSLDDSNFYITDKGGLYTNGATSPSLTTNILDARSFGGTVYVSSTKATSAVSILSSPTASSLTPLPGQATGGVLPGDSAIQDFYLIQSGSNGSTYDVLYTLDQNSSASGSATINKFSLVSGSWVSNGSYTLTSTSTSTGTAINATGMIAENNGSGGASLYVVTTAQNADNSVVLLTDTAGWGNTAAANIDITAAPVTLYTASGSNTLKGIAFAPTPSTAPIVSSPASSNIGINTATLGGTVTSTGGQNVTGYGVVYSLTSENSDPTIGGTDVIQVPGSGSAPISAPFTVSATGLQGTSGYSYAAYAINSVGTSYSSVDTFSTLNANPPAVDTPTDITPATKKVTYQPEARARVR